MVPRIWLFGWATETWTSTVASTCRGGTHAVQMCQWKQERMQRLEAAGRIAAEAAQGQWKLIVRVAEVQAFWLSLPMVSRH